MNPERYAKGAERLKKMKNTSTIGSRLRDVSPDLDGYIKEYAFGDIHSRPGLSARDREMVIISALATLGFAQEELCSHINMGLNAGLSRQEILEVFIQLSVYAGFPAAVNATFVAKEIFAERDAQGIDV
jgi:4-carboxymuconolactone decarboxylase